MEWYHKHLPMSHYWLILPQYMQGISVPSLSMGKRVVTDLLALPEMALGCHVAGMLPGGQARVVCSQTHEGASIKCPAHVCSCMVLCPCYMYHIPCKWSHWTLSPVCLLLSAFDSVFVDVFYRRSKIHIYHMVTAFFPGPTLINATTRTYTWR